MKYEFRVWNKIDKLPNVTPQKAAGRLAAIASAIGGDNRGNPDILIDTNNSGEGAIEAAEISYYTEKIKVNNIETQQRFIKMSIKGNLYLPPDTSLTDAAKSLAGTKGVENSKRDTLLLSKWAAAKPTDVITEQNKNVEQPYYRAVILSILTKAGDFRLISAKNMYVESYSENYSEGEFGTFQLLLKQKFDVSSTFTVAGLESEPVSLLSKIGKGVESAAKIATAVGTAAVVAATVVKTTTETVEKFTGETEATRKIKGISTATSSAGTLTQNTAGLTKDIKNKNYGKLADDVTKVSDSSNDLVKKSKSAHGNSAIPLSQMEELYLSWIKASPDSYKKYLEASDSEKRKMLEEAAQQKLDRSSITKYYEESSIDMEKVAKTEKDIADKKSTK